MSARDSLERYRKSVEIGMRDEDRSYMHEMERRIKTLENYASLGEQPAIHDFVEWAKRDIRAMNVHLSTDRGVNPEANQKRLAMIDRKEVLLYLVGLFSPHEELAFLESALNEQAQKFEDYQSDRGE